MGVELAQYVTHGPGGFLVLCPRGEAELCHRVDDATLHRLEPVTDMRQRTVENDVHGIVQIRLLREVAQRRAFHSL